MNIGYEYHTWSRVPSRNFRHIRLSRSSFLNAFRGNTVTFDQIYLTQMMRNQNSNPIFKLFCVLTRNQGWYVCLWKKYTQQNPIKAKTIHKTKIIFCHMYLFHKLTISFYNRVFPRWKTLPCDIGTSLVSFIMIFEALQSELFRFQLQSLSRKIPKFPEFNLSMSGL